MDVGRVVEGFGQFEEFAEPAVEGSRDGEGKYFFQRLLYHVSQPAPRPRLFDLVGRTE